MADPMDLLEQYRKFREQKEAPLDLSRPQQIEDSVVLPPKPYSPTAEDINYIDQHEGTQNTGLYDDMTGQGLGQEDIASGNFQGNPTLPGGKLVTPDALQSGTVQIGGKDRDIYAPVGDAERKNIIADSIKTMANPILEQNAPADLLTPEQRRAMLSRTYNLGNKAFKNKSGNKNDFGALAQMAKDNPDMLNRLLPLMGQANDEVKAGGIELPGLVKRREDESKDLTTVSSLADLGKQDRGIISATEAAGRKLGQPMSPDEEAKLADIKERLNSTTAPGEIDLAKGTQPPKEPTQPQDVREFLMQEYNKLLKLESSPQLDQSELKKAQTLDAISNIAENINRYGRNPNILPGQKSDYYGQELNKQKVAKESMMDQMRNRTNLLTSLSNLKNKGMIGQGKTIRLGNKIYQQDENGDLQIVAEDQDKESREKMDAQRRKDALDYSKEKGDRPSDKQVETIGGIQNSLNMLDRIGGFKKGVNTGPYASKMQQAKPYLPGMEKDPGFVDLEQTTGLNLFDYIKQQSGTAFSDKEYSNLQKNMPNVEDDDATFNRKLANIKQILQQKQQNTTKTIEKQGKNVDAFKNKEEKQIEKKQYSKSQDKTKIIYKDGSEEILDGKQ